MLTAMNSITTVSLVGAVLKANSKKEHNPRIFRWHAAQRQFQKMPSLYNLLRTSVHHFD